MQQWKDIKIALYYFVKVVTKRLRGCFILTYSVQCHAEYCRLIWLGVTSSTVWHDWKLFLREPKLLEHKSISETAHIVLKIWLQLSASHESDHMILQLHHCSSRPNHLLLLLTGSSWFTRTPEDLHRPPRPKVQDKHQDQTFKTKT